MKLGVCTSPKNADLVKSLGYDYIEVQFGWLTSLTNEEFRAESALYERSPLTAEVFHYFFAGPVSLYAPDGDQSECLKDIARRAELGFSRAAAWGGELAILGSAYARRVPNTITFEEADKQFARVLAVCGEAAERHGMKLLLEPLSTIECNYLHTVAECAAAAKRSGSSAVATMVDFYHLLNNNDAPESLPALADSLFHAHYARPGDRGIPREEDIPLLKTFADYLKRCPNVTRLSLESNWAPDLETAIKAARPLLEVFKSV